MSEELPDKEIVDYTEEEPETVENDNDVTEEESSEEVPETVENDNDVAEKESSEEEPETSEEPTEEDSETVEEVADAVPETVVVAEYEKKKDGFFKRKAKEKVEEKVSDPDSIVESFKRNWKLTFGHYVILRTLRDDPETGGVIRESELCKRSELPINALPCTGEKKVYCIDRIKNTDWFVRSRAELEMKIDPCEFQFTASDADLFMQSDAFDNALQINWTEWNHVDWKKYLMIAGIGIAALILFFMLR